MQLTPAGLALKKRARRVPVSLLQHSVVPIGEIIKLREQLKRLRAALSDGGDGFGLSASARSPDRCPPSHSKVIVHLSWPATLGATSTNLRCQATRQTAKPALLRIALRFEAWDRAAQSRAREPIGPRCI